MKINFKIKGSKLIPGKTWITYKRNFEGIGACYLFHSIAPDGFFYVYDWDPRTETQLDGKLISGLTLENYKEVDFKEGNIRFSPKFLKR